MHCSNAPANCGAHVPAATVLLVCMWLIHVAHPTFRCFPNGWPLRGDVGSIKGHFMKALASMLLYDIKTQCSLPSGDVGFYVPHWKQSGPSLEKELSRTSALVLLFLRFGSSAFLFFVSQLLHGHLLRPCAWTRQVPSE